MINFIQDKIITSIGVGLFIISCMWMILESISRTVFSKSFSISEELVVFTLIWAIFLTIGQSGKEGNHIFVDLFTRKFSPKWKRISVIFNATIGLIYAGFIVYVGINYIDHLASTGITSYSSMRLPMWFVFLCIPIGMLFLAWYYFTVIVEEIRSKRTIVQNSNHEIQGKDLHL